MANDAVTAHPPALGGAARRAGKPARSGQVVGTAVYDGGLRAAHRGELIVQEQRASEVNLDLAGGYGRDHLTRSGHQPGRQAGYRPAEGSPMWRPALT